MLLLLVVAMYVLGLTIWTPLFLVAAALVFVLIQMARSAADEQAARTRAAPHDLTRILLKKDCGSETASMLDIMNRTGKLERLFATPKYQFFYAVNGYTANRSKDVGTIFQVPSGCFSME